MLIVFQDIPSLSVAESLVEKGRQIPILFDELSQLESQVKTSQDWKDQAANIFLKRRSQFTLLEVSGGWRQFGRLEALLPLLLIPSALILCYTVFMWLTSCPFSPSIP